MPVFPGRDLDLGAVIDEPKILVWQTAAIDQFGERQTAPEIGSRLFGSVDRPSHDGIVGISDDEFPVRRKKKIIALRVQLSLDVQIGIGDKSQKSRVYFVVDIVLRIAGDEKILPIWRPDNVPDKSGLEMKDRFFSFDIEETDRIVVVYF